MNTKDIIIHLIIEDMRFNQYIFALRKSGINVSNFDLDLISVVAKLMNIKEEDLTDSWVDLYISELSNCMFLPIEPAGKNLYSLAENCYYSLLDFED